MSYNKNKLLYEKIMTKISVVVKRILTENLSFDELEGFDFRNNNTKMTFNPHHERNGDTKIFTEDGEFKVRKIVLPKSGVMSYNLYDFTTLDIKKALKHKKNGEGKDVEYGTIHSDASDDTIDSIDFFCKRSAQYIKHILGNANIDYITFPQTSKNNPEIGFESFNLKMTQYLRKLYPETTGIRLIPEMLVKNVRNLFVNVDVARQNGLTDAEIHNLQKSIDKWKSDEDIREIRQKVEELINEVEEEKRTRGRGRPSREFMNKVAQIELLKKQIELMRKGKRGRDATFDKMTGKIKEWQIKSLSDETRRSIEGLYELNPKYISMQYKFNGKSVVLFDDNISSGATLDDACLALKKLGVKEIYVFTIAVISPTIYAPSERAAHNKKKLLNQ